MQLNESFLLGHCRTPGVTYEGLTIPKLQPVIFTNVPGDSCYFINQFGTSNTRRPWDVGQERVNRILKGDVARHKVFSNREISFMLAYTETKQISINFLRSLAEGHKRCTFVLTGSRLKTLVEDIPKLEKEFKTFYRTYEYYEDASRSNDNYIFMLSIYDLSTIVANLKNRTIDGFGLAIEVLNKYNTSRYKMPMPSYSTYMIFTNNYEDVYFRDCVEIIRCSHIDYGNMSDMVYQLVKYQKDEDFIGAVSFEKSLKPQMKFKTPSSARISIQEMEAHEKSVIKAKQLDSDAKFKARMSAKPVRAEWDPAFDDLDTYEFKTVHANDEFQQVPIPVPAPVPTTDMDLLNESEYEKYMAYANDITAKAIKTVTAKAIKTGVCFSDGELAALQKTIKDVGLEGTVDVKRKSSDNTTNEILQVDPDMYGTANFMPKSAPVIDDGPDWWGAIEEGISDVAAVPQVDNKHVTSHKVVKATRSAVSPTGRHKKEDMYRMMYSGGGGKSNIAPQKKTILDYEAYEVDVINEIAESVEKKKQQNVKSGQKVYVASNKAHKSKRNTSKVISTSATATATTTFDTEYSGGFTTISDTFIKY